MPTPKAPTSSLDAIRSLPVNSTRAVTRTAQIYELLRDAIYDGSLPPGEPLSEKAIADHLEVSRTPVREALRQLEFDGLARPGPSGALAVADYSPDELEQLGMMRIVLEGLAARSAATLRTQTEVAILEDLVDEFAEAVDKSDLWMMVSANRAFHETIADASRNTFLMRQLKALRLAIERMDQTTLVSTERQRETLEEHRAVLAAMAEQDAALAERLTREHFEKALKLRVRQSHARLRERRLAQRSDQTRS